jgi:phosphatidylinositol alpha-mannosyltransferase
MRSFRPDVVHAHEPLTASTSLFAVLQSRSPVVATFHSGADRSRLFDVAAPALRRIVDRITVRVAVSERAAGFVRERLGGTYEIVPNGVDVARFETAEPAELGPGRWVLFVGRLDERKGFPAAVRAFERLADRFPDLHLVVAGSGPDATALDALPSEARTRVHMLGRVRSEDLPRFHRAAELLIAPSVGGESFGMVLAEAMSASLPVVASDIPGYREVVRDGVDGLLVAPRSPYALAAASERLLRDRELADAMGSAGHARARELFDWAVVTETLEGIYRRVAAR